MRKLQIILRPIMLRRKKNMMGPSFAYSLPVHSFHTRRDRVASLKTCRLHGAAIQRASPLRPGRALTLPCGWNNAGPAEPARLALTIGGVAFEDARVSREEMQALKAAGKLPCGQVLVLLNYQFR